jgi:hypothetical protein
MISVLRSFESVDVAYYISIPWDNLSNNNAVAVAVASCLWGRPAGIVITVFATVPYFSSITSHVFAVGRLTMTLRSDITSQIIR